MVGLLDEGLRVILPATDNGSALRIEYGKSHFSFWRTFRKVQMWGRGIRRFPGGGGSSDTTPQPPIPPISRKTKLPHASMNQVSIKLINHQHQLPAEVMCISTCRLC